MVMASGRGMGGPMQPDDVCTKSGKPILEVLCSKNILKFEFLNRKPNVDGTLDGFDNYAFAHVSVHHASSKYDIN